MHYGTSVFSDRYPVRQTLCVRVRMCVRLNVHVNNVQSHEPSKRYFSKSFLTLILRDYDVTYIETFYMIVCFCVVKNYCLRPSTCA